MHRHMGNWTTRAKIPPLPLDRVKEIVIRIWIVPTASCAIVEEANSLMAWYQAALLWMISTLAKIFASKCTMVGCSFCQCWWWCLTYMSAFFSSATTQQRSNARSRWNRSGVANPSSSYLHRCTIGTHKLTLGTY